MLSSCNLNRHFSSYIWTISIILLSQICVPSVQAAFFTEVFVNLNSDGAITHEVNGSRMFPIDKPIKVTFMLSGAALQPVEIWSPEGWSPIYNFSVSPPKDHTILFIKDAAEWRELDLIPGDFNEPSGISEK